jgi:hypothetical protein
MGFTGSSAAHQHHVTGRLGKVKRTQLINQGFVNLGLFEVEVRKLFQLFLIFLHPKSNLIRIRITSTKHHSFT